MLKFYKFAEHIPAPVPARAMYHRREPGKGWPEECPPVRAANAFGWDVLAAFDMLFTQADGRWRLEEPVDVESDWAYSTESDGDDEGPDENDGDGGRAAADEPLIQRNAWFWDEDQILPHAISKSVYRQIANQVKVSTFLFVASDENELLYITDIPNMQRPFRALSALVDTDWYAASYPWHCVLELDPAEKQIRIAEGEPLCRLFTVRRDQYFAREMTTVEFETFFQRGQEWLRRHGKGEREGMVDITGNYGKQQVLSRFTVIV